MGQVIASGRTSAAQTQRIQVRISNLYIIYHSVVRGHSTVETAGNPTNTAFMLILMTLNLWCVAASSSITLNTTASSWQGTRHNPQLPHTTLTSRIFVNSWSTKYLVLSINSFLETYNWGHNYKYHQKPNLMENLTFTRQKNIQIFTDVINWNNRKKN